MKPDDSDRSYEYFRRTTEDWTPAGARHSANVLFAPVSFDLGIIRSCSGVLSGDELKRAEKFLTAEDKNQFIQRRAFRRFCGALALESTAMCRSQIVFEETEKGRPYLSRAPELWFSFSSCRFGFVGAWSFTHRVGVDIEDRTQQVETQELAQHFFSEREAAVVDKAGDAGGAQTFFRLWSLKESALKSIGEGIPFGLDAFQFDLSPGPHVRQAPRAHGRPHQFDPHLIERPNTCAALVTHLK